MKRLAVSLALLASLVPWRPGQADSFSYGLEAQQVAPGTYVFIGSTEHFTRENGGNIVNTGFIVTDTGVVVIDTGPSARYGREMRAAIQRITVSPILQVIITHHHPDHFLGNQAFTDVPIRALPATIAGIRSEGDAMTENLYRLVGKWMLGTEVIAPSEAIKSSAEIIGGHRLRFIPLKGHDQADLVIFDETTGVMFTGDLAFMDRAPTTPHADIEAWLKSLDELDRLDFRLMVPGHGPVVRDRRAIEQTRDYLGWLGAHLVNAAVNGLEMTEVMRLPIPEAFAGLSTVEEEYRRSVNHLWPGIVAQTLPSAVDRRAD